MNNLVEGILYDPKSVKIYEGLFINNNPKEGKNIKYYFLNGDLLYEGDFIDGKYHGHGILYEKGFYEKKGIFSENKYLNYVGKFKNGKYDGHGKLYKVHFLGRYLLYEGNFNNSYFSCYGKMYYQNKILFYEGQFEKNNIKGEGFKYYKNGKLKFQGTFENNMCTLGIYYSPDGKKLYEGEFKNEIPLNSKNIIIYDNNTNKLYEGEIKNGMYEGEGIEYCPLIKDKVLFEGNFKNNEFILPNIEIEKPKEGKLKFPKISLLSLGDIPGKSCFLNRIKGNEFRYDIPSTIGMVKTELFFENNNLKYKLIFLDISGTDRYISTSITSARYSNIVIYLFDISSEYNEISLDFITMIREEAGINKIYIVGNKLDLINEKNMELINKEYLEKFRSKAMEAINKKLVDKYFEISVKTGEGMDKLMNSLKMDSLMYLKSLEESMDNFGTKRKIKQKT